MRQISPALGELLLGAGTTADSRYTTTMQLTLELPDELSAALAVSGQDLSRAVFEAVALEAYRERKLGKPFGPSFRFLSTSVFPRS
jgi:hypothetical protein